MVPPVVSTTLSLLRGNSDRI